MKRRFVFLVIFSSCLSVFSQFRCDEWIIDEPSDYSKFIIDTLYFNDYSNSIEKFTSDIEAISKQIFDIDSCKSLQLNGNVESALDFIDRTFQVSLKDSSHLMIGGFFRPKDGYPDSWILLLEVHLTGEEVVRKITRYIKKHENYYQLVRFPIFTKFYDLYTKGNKLYLVTMGENINNCKSKDFHKLLKSFGLYSVEYGSGEN
ncbi:MAG: hypothetical protein AAF388_19845 [Bacteroidota bacterium]